MTARHHLFHHGSSEKMSPMTQPSEPMEMVGQPIAGEPVAEPAVEAPADIALVLSVDDVATLLDIKEAQLHRAEEEAQMHRAGFQQLKKLRAELRDNDRINATVHRS